MEVLDLNLVKSYLVFAQEAIKDEVDFILYIASKYGKIVGTFLLKYIVSQQDNKEMSLKDYITVDLWFHDLESFDNFMKYYSKIYPGDKTFLINCSGWKYDELNKNKYNIITVQKYGLVIAKLNILINDNFPYNDFDVNQLAGTIDSKRIFSLTCYGAETLEAVLNKIKSRVATLPKEYALLMEDKNNNDIIHKNINENYLANGWQIIIHHN